MLTPVVRLWTGLAAWPVRTQQGSRRNALVASTALAARRREREEVEEYLVHHAARHARQAVRHGLAGRTRDAGTLEVAVRPA